MQCFVGKLKKSNMRLVLNGNKALLGTGDEFLVNYNPTISTTLNNGLKICFVLADVIEKWLGKEIIALYINIERYNNDNDDEEGGGNDDGNDDDWSDFIMMTMINGNDMMKKVMVMAMMIIMLAIRQ